MPIAGKVYKALGEIGIMCGQRVFDFALRHRRIKFVFQRMVGNTRRIIKAANRLDRAWYRIGCSHGE